MTPQAVPPTASAPPCRPSRPANARRPPPRARGTGGRARRWRAAPVRRSAPALDRAVARSSLRSEAEAERCPRRGTPRPPRARRPPRQSRPPASSPLRPPAASRLLGPRRSAGRMHRAATSWAACSSNLDFGSSSDPRPNVRSEHGYADGREPGGNALRAADAAVLGTVSELTESAFGQGARSAGLHVPHPGPISNCSA